jgi:hypothetical protein
MGLGEKVKEPGLIILLRESLDELFDRFLILKESRFIIGDLFLQIRNLQSQDLPLSSHSNPNKKEDHQ